MTDAVHLAGPDGLRIVVTGTGRLDADLVESLEESVSGLRVVGTGAAASDVPAHLLADPSLTAVVHGTAWDPADEDASAARLAFEVEEIKRHTRAPIILLAADSGPSLVEAALASGVSDVLVLPQRPETLLFAAHKASRAGTASPVAAPAAPAAVSTGGEVITIFSPKGGTGKTALATNLSAYLAARSRKRVLLIDLDLQFGDAAIMLGLETERTLHELVQDPGDLDPGKLAAYTTRHRSGLDVLAAPPLPEQADDVSEEKVLRLVEVARQAYDLVVIDTSPFFYGPMMALLDPTDKLLLLCGLDVPTLKNVRLSLRTLKLLGFPPERASIILNRVTPNVGLTAADVETALEVRVAFEVPNDASVPLAVNKGTSAALDDADSDFTRAIALIAESLEPSLVPATHVSVTRSLGATRLRRLVPRRALEGRA